MPGNRPYDAQQALRLTEWMVENNSSVVSSPTAPPELSVIHNPEFEEYPGRVSEALTAIRGIARFVTPEGRAQIAEERADELERGIQVARFLGDSIAKPPAGPTTKIGWVGTHKRESRRPHRPEDLVNLGFQLLDGKNLKGTHRANPEENPDDPDLPYHQLIDEGPAPIPLRPTNRAQELTSKHLERAWKHKVTAQKHASWLNRSYGMSLSRGHHALSRPERNHMHKLGRELRKAEQEAREATEAFEAIADSRDAYGMRARARIDRYREKAARLRGEVDTPTVEREHKIADKARQIGTVVRRHISHGTDRAKEISTEATRKATERTKRAVVTTGRSIARGTRKTVGKTRHAAKTTGRGVAHGVRKSREIGAKPIRKTVEAGGRAVSSVKERTSPERRELNGRIKRQLRNERNTRRILETPARPNRRFRRNRAAGLAPMEVPLSASEIADAEDFLQEQAPVVIEQEIAQDPDGEWVAKDTSKPKPARPKAAAEDDSWVNDPDE